MTVLLQYMFCVLQITIRESQTEGDVMGRAVLVVQRVQGTQGLVNVQWRLNAGAQDDFVPPLEGTLQFTGVTLLAEFLALFRLLEFLIIIITTIIVIIIKWIFFCTVFFSRKVSTLPFTVTKICLYRC